MPFHIPQSETYQKDSQVAQEAFESLEAAAFLEIRKSIVNETPSSLAKIVELQNSGEPSVSLQAAKFICKLAGLETERVQHSGKVAFEPFCVSRCDEEEVDGDKTFTGIKRN